MADVQASSLAPRGHVRLGDDRQTAGPPTWTVIGLCGLMLVAEIEGLPVAAMGLAVDIVAAWLRSGEPRRGHRHGEPRGPDRARLAGSDRRPASNTPTRRSVRR
jgi:hypothetical protein